MFNSYRVYNLLPKQNFQNHTSRLFSNNKGHNFCRNEKISKLSSSNARNQCSQVLCRYKDSFFPLNSGLSFYPEKNFALNRNFSTSNTIWSWLKSNQDKEKIRNYILFGGIFASLILVVIMVQTMDYHQDYVYVEPTEEKK